jgi:hypothetical protein
MPIVSHRPNEVFLVANKAYLTGAAFQPLL